MCVRVCVCVCGIWASALPSARANGMVCSRLYVAGRFVAFCFFVFVSCVVFRLCFFVDFFYFLFARLAFLIVVGESYIRCIFLFCFVLSCTFLHVAGFLLYFALLVLGYFQPDLW